MDVKNKERQRRESLLLREEAEEHIRAVISSNALAHNIKRLLKHRAQKAAAIEAARKAHLQQTEATRSRIPTKKNNQVRKDKPESRCEQIFTAHGSLNISSINCKLA